MGLGWKDEAVETVKQDQFKIEQYIVGLSNFIKDCDTPMTIAIQGDWGSGKTSVMNMVKNKLDNKVIPVWFNTWQFSQFTMGDELAIVFLNYLCKALCVKGEPWTDKLVNAVTGLGKTVVKVVGDKTEQMLGSNAINSAINEKLEKNAIDIISDLKETFQGTVNKLSEKNDGKRIVFYIDDLDRLQPLRAVELLEILKIFLDCENCVFVLAIDYEVVSQGIKEKYKNTLDERKSRKFFEKMIQVPFKMPVAHYNIDSYIADTLKHIGISEEKYSQSCADLIRTSIGYNPRAMKRTFNAYLLLTKVHSGEQEVKSEFGKLLLFASLCMQLVYEEVYNYLVAHLAPDEEYEDVFVADADFFQSVLETGITEENCDDEFYNIVTGSKEYDIKEITSFLQSFAKLICKGKDRIDEKALEELQGILQMTSITATGNLIHGNNVVGKGARKAKVYDEHFKQCSLNSLEDKTVKSFNAAIFEWYEIAGERVVCTSKFKFAEFIKHAMEYAYEYNPAKFNELRDTAIKSEKSAYSNLFSREKTSNPKSFKVLDNCKYEISTHSSNDAKVGQVRKVYEEMGIDSKSIIFSMKEAYNA